MVTGTLMAKRTGGGTRKGDGDAGTKLVRVHADLAEMISWITRMEGMSASTLLDPLLRAEITRRYKQLETDIKVIQKAEAKHRKDESA